MSASRVYTSDDLGATRVERVTVDNLAQDMDAWIFIQSCGTVTITPELTPLPDLVVSATDTLAVSRDADGDVYCCCVNAFNMAYARALLRVQLSCSTQGASIRSTADLRDAGASAGALMYSRDGRTLHKFVEYFGQKCYLATFLFALDRTDVRTVEYIYEDRDLAVRDFVLLECEPYVLK